jgi:hypothetical protein
VIVRLASKGAPHRAALFPFRVNVAVSADEKPAAGALFVRYCTNINAGGLNWENPILFSPQ